MTHIHIQMYSDVYRVYVYSIFTVCIYSMYIYIFTQYIYSLYIYSIHLHMYSDIYRVCVCSIFTVYIYSIYIYIFTLYIYSIYLLYTSTYSKYLLYTSTLYISICTVIERTPSPQGVFLFTMFPDQEPGGRGPPLKNHPENGSILEVVLHWGSSSSRFLIREHSK